MMIRRPSAASARGPMPVMLVSGVDGSIANAECVEDDSVHTCARRTGFGADGDTRLSVVRFGPCRLGFVSDGSKPSSDRCSDIEVNKLTNYF